MASVIFGHISRVYFAYNLKKSSISLFDQRKGPLLAYIVKISSGAFQGFKDFWCGIQGLQHCHQGSVSVSWLYFFPVLTSVLVIYCCVTNYNKCRGLKLHTLMISWYLCVRRLGTVDLGLWLQAFSTKTATKVSGSTEVSSEGLPWEGSAAKLLWFWKNSIPGGFLDWEPAVSCLAEASPATWISP